MKTALFFLTALVFFSGCLHIEPQPPKKEDVVVLHGFSKSGASMWRLAWALEDAGYRVHRINYKSVRTTIEEVKASALKQIDKCCKNKERRVHFVGHSLGGLLLRWYLGEQKIKNLGRAVMIASPNRGTEYVDHYKDRWWMRALGNVPLEMSAKGSKFLRSLKKPDYELGVIAGNLNLSWQESILGGMDDGLVRVESAKVEGMKDFVIVHNTLHGFMRYDREVIKQVIYFLEHGKFYK